MSTDETQAFEPAPRPTGESTQPLDREHRLDEVIAAYLRAVRVGEASDQQEWLARHPDLAPELAEFFADQERVERLAGPVRAAVTAGPPVGSKVGYVGDYELLEELGRGGMGVVYKARQGSLKRTVALKMILAGVHASPQDLARFRAEAEAVARLQHPHIVQIHEIGEHEGHPYAALEFVEGGSLDRKLAGTPLPARQAARLVEVLARAVHVAHQQGIVHRDLKPANVLLAPSDRPQAIQLDSAPEAAACYEPKVTDFGLAKLVKEEASQTESGSILGTPSYMAPEQAAGKTKEVGPAADLYALGAILYELLTGRPPFRAATPLDTVMQVVTEEPVPPRQLQPKLPRDLETICLKCLEKEPGKRYAAAEALAEDLDRWLSGEPIRARPTPAWERAAKWARRRPAVAGLTALTFLLTVVGVAGISWQWRAAEAARQDALAKAAAETAARGDEAVARARADAARIQAEQARDAEAREREKAESEAYVAQIALASARIDQGIYGDVEEMLDRCPPRLRHWEWGWLKHCCRRYLFSLRHETAVTCVAFSPNVSRLATGNQDGTVRVWDAGTGKLMATLTGHAHPVNKICFSEDGKTILTSGMDETSLVGPLDRTAHRSNTVKIWDASTAKEVRTFQGSYQALSGNGKRVLTVDRGLKVHLWEAETGKEIAVVQAGFGPTGANLCTISPDGSRFLAGANVVNPETKKASFNGHVWDAAGKEITTLALPFVLRTTFSPDGKRLLATVTDVYTVKTKTILIDTDTGKEVAALPVTWFWTPATFSPQGRRVVIVGEDLARVFDVGTGKQITSWKVSPSPMRSVVYDAEGKRLLTAGDDATARVWNAENGDEMAVFKGHSAGLSSAVFSPDGQRIFTGSLDRTARLWNVQGEATRSLHGHPLGVTSVAVSPAGNQVISARGNRFAPVWNPVSGKELFRLQQEDGAITSAIFSIDGQRVLTRGGRIGGGSSIAPMATVWEARTGKRLASVEVLQRGESFGMNCLAFSPDGKQIVTGGPEPVGKVWDGDSGKEIGTLEGHTKGLHFVAFSADGKRILSASGDHTIRIWDAETKKVLAAIPEAGHVWYATFSPNRKRMLVCTRDAQMTKFPVKLLDAETGETIHTLPEPKEIGRSFSFFSGGEFASRHNDGSLTNDYLRVISQPVVFSPDGSRFLLTFGGQEGVVPVWDTTSGRERVVLKGSHPLRTVAFSPDGKRIVTGGIVGKLARLWDAGTGRELLNFSQRTEVTAVAFSPEGRRMLVGCADGSIKIYPTANWSATEPERNEPR